MMTAHELVNAAANLPVKWHLTKTGMIRDSYGRCPIVAVAYAQLGRRWSNRWAPYAAGKLGIGFADRSGLVNAADSPITNHAELRRYMERKLLWWLPLASEPV